MQLNVKSGRTSRIDEIKDLFNFDRSYEITKFRDIFEVCHTKIFQKKSTTLEIFALKQALNFVATVSLKNARCKKSLNSPFVCIFENRPDNENGAVLTANIDMYFSG